MLTKLASRNRLSVLLVLAATGCTPTLTQYKPPATQFATFMEAAGTVDVNGPCTPPTPPAPAAPAGPASAQVLVGDQLWRNTHRDSSGTECQESRAGRWEGILAFDMTQVLADINAKPFSTLTGTLTYQIGAYLQVPSSNDLPMCVASIEKAAAAPIASGVFTLNFAAGATFPPSSPPTLGPRVLPASVPFGQVYNTGVVVIDPSPPFPTVTLDLSLLLSDWAAARSAALGVALVPLRPSLEELGIGNDPPTPIPDSLSTFQCTSIVKNVTLTVNVGR
jgi:hypothetical protein